MGSDLLNVTSYARMNANKSCLIKRYKSLLKAVEKNDIEKVYRSTSELLYWIINTNDLLFAKFKKEYKEKIKEQKNNIEEILLGLRFAFNANKHNMNIFSLSYENIRKFGTLTFNEWLWADFSLYNPNPKQKKFYDAYIKSIQGDLIIGTLNIAKNFLIEQINNLQK
ncbi:hypothetical protein BFM98_07055 [Lysinibacillus sp. AR18-8]|uniref:hypothetical protein n=1 Tax=Lysinibacillus sp. AR18-8 TaxID=1889781 RepID=UPI000824DC64|nr:hypothetical protein [Lysinibacillus sp. AR18-8]OCX64791.1 hypothetical protein BFM98_07055 [Lysinibacillus sp. AR18-8]